MKADGHLMIRTLPVIIIVSLLSLALPSFVAAAAWPADSGQEIGEVGNPGGLPSDYEPSGAVWHPLRNKLIVVDDSGRVSEMDPLGGNVTTWIVDEDLEGVTIANPADNLIYLAVEQPDKVLEFDLVTGSLTGNQWDLTSWLTGPSNHGLEALTYVDGLFYAGLQEDGQIFIFDFQAAGVVQYLGSISPHLGRDDLSGLHYDACTEVLYAVHDSHDVIVEMSAAGAFLREYDLPRDDQEGIAVIGDGVLGQTTVFVAEDAGSVMRYDQYPIEACLSTSVGELPTSQNESLESSPNPFNPTTVISFHLSSTAAVRLSIYDARGQRVRVLVTDTLSFGDHTVTWNGCSDDGTSLSSGLYFARLDSEDQQATTKLILAR
jgi:hypothetical protein